MNLLSQVLEEKLDQEQEGFNKEMGEDEVALRKILEPDWKPPGEVEQEGEWKPHP